jgi:hypothetical protein
MSSLLGVSAMGKDDVHVVVLETLQRALQTLHDVLLAQAPAAVSCCNPDSMTDTYLVFGSFRPVPK